MRRYLSQVSRRDRKSSTSNGNADMHALDNATSRSALPDSFIQSCPPTMSFLARSLYVTPEDVEPANLKDPTADDRNHPKRNFTKTWIASSDFRKAPRPPALSSLEPLDPQELGQRKSTTKRSLLHDGRPPVPPKPSVLKRLEHIRARGGTIPKELLKAFDDAKEDENYAVAFARSEADDIVDVNRATIAEFDKTISGVIDVVVEEGIARDANTLNASEDETPTVSSKEIAHRWYHNEDAKDGIVNAASVFYCLCATIFALVFEIGFFVSEEQKGQKDAKNKRELKDQALGIYMYAMSIAFFLYCYAFLIRNPHWIRVAKRRFLAICRRKNRDPSKSSLAALTIDYAETTAATIQRHVSHDMPSAGNLYLRLGCIIFGLCGMIYYTVDTALSIMDNDSTRSTIVLDVLGLVFVFLQMHFIFRNSKMSFHGSYTITRFGVMHLVAANLWAWIRYVFIEQSHMSEHIRHMFAHAQRDQTVETHKSLPSHHFRSVRAADTPTGPINHNDSYAIEVILGNLTEVMYTAMVEYSLIGAAVMFIIWHNIGRAREGRDYIKRKKHFRVDCSKTSTGLFGGLIFLVGSCSAILFFFWNDKIHKPQTAAVIYAISGLIQYVITAFACVYALFRMRMLYYNRHLPDSPHNSYRHSQELLDRLLLAIGLAGELIQSVAGLVGIFGALRAGEQNDNVPSTSAPVGISGALRAGEQNGNVTSISEQYPLQFLLVTVHVASILQVTLQSGLIYIAGSLRTGDDPILRKVQPGKHTITFLLIANITMFMTNLLTVNKAASNSVVGKFYGERSWNFFVRSFTPLVVFYRFHSSVCFVEIWKHTFARKSPDEKMDSTTHVDCTPSPSSANGSPAVFPAPTSAPIRF